MRTNVSMVKWLFVRFDFSVKEDDNPHMPDTTIEHIRKLINNQGMSLEEAAKRSGLDRSYFRKLFERSNASPKGGTLAKIAKGLGVPVTQLLEGHDDGEHEAINTYEPTLPIPKSRLRRPESSDKTIPILGTAAGSHLRGGFQIADGPINVVGCPPAMTEARDLYGLFVVGSSMSPRFEPGDLIFVNPHKPARIGDAIVVQTYGRGDHDEEATIGILIKITPEYLVIGKYNPDSKVEILRSTVRGYFKIMTTNEQYGV